MKEQNTNQGIKESDNKLSWELSFDFLKEMAKRMDNNKGKYPRYNWKKPMDVEKLKQAYFRHTIEIMNSNYKDGDEEIGHITAAACNLMMIYEQLVVKISDETLSGLQ